MELEDEVTSVQDEEVPADLDSQQKPKVFSRWWIWLSLLRAGQLDSKVKLDAYGSCYTMLYSLDGKYTKSQRKCDHTEKGVNHFWNRL